MSGWQMAALLAEQAVIAGFGIAIWRRGRRRREDCTPHPVIRVAEPLTEEAVAKLRAELQRALREKP